MNVARVIADGLSSGDHLWSLPLAEVLGPGGRRASVRWVERCLHRMVDLAGLHPRLVGIHERITGASATASAIDLGEVVAIIERMGLRGDPVVDAIAMLHHAYWNAVRRGDNQFALSQESVFRRMRAFLSDAEWGQVVELAIDEFHAALASLQDAEPLSGPVDLNDNDNHRS